jgi:hypothetical protein
MKVYLKHNGHYLGVMPTPVAGKTGDAQFPVYEFGQNGDTRSGPAGSWETWDLELRPGSTTAFSCLAIAANRQLSLVPGIPGVPVHLETRAAGAIGAWETESAVTEPDGASLLYRLETGDLLDDYTLTIEVAS